MFSYSNLDWVIPVSYTHLDVYKRQPLYNITIDEINMVCITTFFSFRLATDVYKRQE